MEAPKNRYLLLVVSSLAADDGFYALRFSRASPCSHDRIATTLLEYAALVFQPPRLAGDDRRLSKTDAELSTARQLRGRCVSRR